MFGFTHSAPLGGRVAAAVMATAIAGAGLAAATPADAAGRHHHPRWIPGKHRVIPHHVYRGDHRRPAYWRHGYHRYYDRGSDNWVGAGIAGLAAGALIGGVLAPHYTYAAPAYAPPAVVYAPGTSDWYSYCASRYRSFDPRSGTYLGYDGLRHACR